MSPAQRSGAALREIERRRELEAEARVAADTRGEAALPPDARAQLAARAEVLALGETRRARSARAGLPADADDGSDREARVLAGAHDPSDNLVPGHERPRDVTPVAVEEVHVAVADRAAHHLDVDVAPSGGGGSASAIGSRGLRGAVWRECVDAHDLGC